MLSVIGGIVTLIFTHTVAQTSKLNFVTLIKLTVDVSYMLVVSVRRVWFHLEDL